MAGWSLWPPLEGEGTGVDRWPPRKFPLLVWGSQYQAHAVSGSGHSSARFRLECDSSIPVKENGSHCRTSATGTANCSVFC